MSDIQTAASVWPVLLPVIAGGVLTMLASAVVPAVTDYLTAKRARLDLRRERFEEMLTAAWEQDHWLSEGSRSAISGAVRESGPAPITKAITIALLHFPTLVGPVRVMDFGSASYQSWMAEASIRRLNNDLVRVHEGFADAHKEWLTGFRAFQEAVASYAAERKGDV